MSDCDFFGTPVLVSPALPIYPSFGEDIRRRVRHGLSDVLAWLGEEVGPEPGEPTKVIWTPHGLFVSQGVYEKMRELVQKVEALG